MIIACIPVYNEELTISEVVLEVLQFVDLVIVCDDGSTDNTASLAEASGGIVIKHEQNLGKGAALNTAFKKAINFNPSIVIMMDGDGQHSPSDIPALLKPIQNNNTDVTLGSRFIKGSSSNPPFYRKIGLGAINILNQLSGINTTSDIQSGFRAFNRKALANIIYASEKGYNIETEQIYRLSRDRFSITDIPITVQYNVPNPSKKNPIIHGFKIFSFLTKVIFFEKPLLYFCGSGLILIVSGMIIAFYRLSVINKTIYWSIASSFCAIGFLLSGISLIRNGFSLHQIKKSKSD